LINLELFSANSSLIRLREWKELAEKSSKFIKFIVVGNKHDLPNRTVTKANAQSFASEIDAPYIETSACTFIGVQELREKIKQMVITFDREFEG
jgi:tRNA U34 5-carboxymethylaminomethyl modifying GTPase MnmE/TrmE